jgi:hypothetical protein
MGGLGTLVNHGQCFRNLFHSADDIPQRGRKIAELVVEISDLGMFHGVLLRFEAASGVPQFCMSTAGLTLDRAAALDIRAATADRDRA